MSHSFESIKENVREEKRRVKTSRILCKKNVPSGTRLELERVTLAGKEVRICGRRGGEGVV